MKYCDNFFENNIIFVENSLRHGELQGGAARAVPPSFRASALPMLGI